MMERHRQVLLVSDRSAACERLQRLLPSLAHLVVPDPTAAVTVVEEQELDLVVIDHPVRGRPLAAFLAALRRRDSPSRQAAMVVLTEPDTLEQAEELFARGAARIVNCFASDERLQAVFQDVLEHPPRLTLKALVRMTLADTPAHARIIAQTDNVSLTGMLVRHDKALPIGGRLSFDLELPGQPVPIRGVAAVVRLTFDPAEEVTGFAARFVSLEGDGRRRLEIALESVVQRSPTPKKLS